MLREVGNPHAGTQLKLRFVGRLKLLHDADGIEHVGTPLKFSKEPGRVSFTVPGQGEHTTAVLGAAGFTAEETAALHAAGALG